MDTEKGDYANFDRWLFQVSKEGFGEISLEKLKQFAVELKVIFEKISFAEDGERFFNDFYDLAEINKQIRLAFHTRRELNTKSEVFEQSAKMLIVESLQAIAKSSKLYPGEDETKEILAIDGEGLDLEARQAKLNEDFERLLEMAKAQGLENLIQRKPNEVSFPVAHKDRTFHFLPYKFDSNLEKDIFIEALRDDYLKTAIWKSISTAKKTSRIFGFSAIRKIINMSVDTRRIL